MIPENEWIWQGHPGHFCAASYCRFHLATRVGDYLISTVGDYYTNPEDGERKEIGYSADGSAWFETYVFKVAGTLDCGCAEVDGWSEIDGERWSEAKMAHDGHLQYCQKYAAKTEEITGDTHATNVQ